MKKTPSSRNLLYVSLMFIAATFVAAGCPSTRQTPEDSTPETKATDGADGTDVDPSDVAVSDTADDGTDLDSTPLDSTPLDSTDDQSDEAVAEKQFAPLFVGWPKPRLALVITGRQHGYFEPCGCSGLATQKGGLNRRYALITGLVEKGWDVLSLDVGNQVRRYGRQAEVKFHTTMDGLKEMDYRGIGLGPDDLRLSIGDLIAEAANDTPFVCANVNLFDMVPQYRVLSAGGKKVGVTAILGIQEQKKVLSDEIVFSTPEDALTEVLPKMKAEGCDYYVLLAHTSIDASKKLARQFPDFDLVVTAGGAGEPTYRPEEIDGTDGVQIQVGEKGMYAGVIGLFDDGPMRLRYQRVPLDAQFKDSEEMLDLLKSYQEQLETLGFFDGLELRAQPHPSGRKFAGSKVCGDCHEKAYEIWLETGHAHATKTLEAPPERGGISRHFDPECVACHVVGWDPKRYAPYKTGFTSIEETPHLQHVGCESCHGPAAKHSAAENGDIDADDDQLIAWQQELHMELSKAEETCMECHDLDNSIEFHKEGAFDRYWKKVEHKGMD